MKCKFFKNKSVMLAEAVHYAILQEESFIDAYLSPIGHNRRFLSPDQLEVVEDSEKRIKDWEAFLHPPIKHQK